MRYPKKAHFSETNPNWKGDDVGYAALHEWIGNRKPKPELCEICRKKPPRDLANISGEYKRDIDDYHWLCRSCHMKKDGIVHIKLYSDVSKLIELNRTPDMRKKSSDRMKKQWEDGVFEAQPWTIERKKKFKKEWLII
jgi:hypothetical protein